MAVYRTSVQGDGELMRLLRALGKTLAKNAARKATRAGARLVQQAAQAAAPVGATRAFKRSIKLKGKTTRTGIVNTYVRTIAPHSSLLEYGTKERKQKQSGRATGKGPTFATLGNAARSRGAAAIQVVQERLLEELQKAGSSGGR